MLKGETRNNLNDLDERGLDNKPARKRSKTLGWAWCIYLFSTVILISYLFIK